MQPPGEPCQAQRRDGSPCQGRALPGSTFCQFHDPARRERQQEARRAGGAAGKKRLAVLPADGPDLPLSSVSEVTSALGLVTNRTLKGLLDVKVANAAGYLLSSLLKALQAGDLEREMAELRGQLAELKTLAQQRAR